MNPVTYKTDLITVTFSRRKLLRRNRVLSVLLGLSDLLSQPRNLEDLLQEALDYVLAHTPFDAGRLYLMEPDGAGLHLVAHRGMDVAGLERVSLHEGFTGRSARTCSFIAQSVASLGDARRVRLLTSKGLAVVVCVPFVVQDRVEGVMNLAARKAVTLDQDQVDLLMVLGHLIGAAAVHMKTEEELRATIRELRARKETIKLFVSTITHDLKSPAVGAYGLARRLSELCRDRLDEREKAYCQQILKATEHIVSMVDELNGFIRTREMPLRLQSVSVGEVWRAVHREFSEQLRQRGVAWQEEGSPEPVTADELMLFRAFRNLVQNALIHGGESLKTLRVGRRDAGTHHVFFVADDGRGIPEEDQGRLFEPFHRLRSSKGVEGSGLGLAIVREAALRHGGDAWVRSRPGEGTAFFFSVAKGLEQTESAETAGG
jgi:signal transduction histidine kinase